ncbi:LamG-like jellyroll fold domain-containing protein [Anaerobaca lacustris]|uniref:PA14 domain-containing protein n=1 Tax=Anaerobaca lacustris TaxID=3044600 RepID=A0AAW6U2X6_9BACT|nr:PA14 domain-containing protein [Sedimentisphaerales bacterium M17dextr]
MRKATLVATVVCLMLSAVSSADVLREIWWGGASIDAAITLVQSGTPADQVDILVEPTWADIADNYVARLSGYILVPADGEYTFYVASDDSSRLFVSQNDNMADAVQVAFVDGWTGSQAWTSMASQQAEPMSLTEGQLMAFWAVMQEGTGGDNLAIGVAGPGIEGIIVLPDEVTFATHPSKANKPNPADGAAGVMSGTLSWGAPATIEDPAYSVYVGTDPEALEMIADGLTETSLEVGVLGVDFGFETTYYWRVDTNGEEGTVWSLTTQHGRPLITKAQGDAVAPGGDAQLVCEATSAAAGELSYQWYREKVIMMGFELNDVPLPEGVDSVLNVAGATIDDEGYYYCVVTNENGSTTSPLMFLDIQTGLIHRWTFDESADGVTIPDVVGGADATLMNGTGNAVIADGQATLANDGSQNSNNAAAGDYIDLPNGIISPLTQMTIECWTTWDGTDAVWQRIYDMGTSNGGEDVSNSGDQTTYFYVTPDSGSRSLLLEYRRLGSQHNMPMTDSGKLAAGEEVLVTQVHDDIAGIVKLYINGTIIGAYKTPVMLNEFIDNNVWLGRSQWGDPLYCGSYNELRIYDTALSAAEIAANFLAGPDVIAEPAAPCDVKVIGDRNGDCVVDFVDAAITADQWLVHSLQD